MHGDAPPKRRAEHYDTFNSGESRILIATDVASRGLDMRVTVEHVILYDFPRNVIDYIHRIGRTARAGNNGYVTAFIGRADQSLAEQIKVISSFEFDTFGNANIIIESVRRRQEFRGYF